MKKIEMKYSFPLFAAEKSLVNLGKNEKLIISDIWAFWDYVVKKASNNEKEKRFLSALLEQAKHFYQSAEGSPVKSQPLLYYYAFLNLAKIMIVMRDRNLMPARFHHGVSEKNAGGFTNSSVELLNRANVENVATRLISLFEVDGLAPTGQLKIKELLLHCVGVHRAYCEIYNYSEVFVRLNEPTLWKRGRHLKFQAEIKNCSSKNIAELKSVGYGIYEDDGGRNYFSVEIQATTQHLKRVDYANLSSEIRKQGIWYFVGNNGHTMYLSKDQNMRLSQESIIYLVMFYLGSITRYHPYLFDELFSDTEQWLMSEFLSTQPKQFLYLASSRALGQSVLKAYASF